jgi:hypothetical protein
MASGLRRRAARGLFLLMVLFLLCACSKKQTIRDDPPRAAVVEALVFLSAVQGNPVCMVIDVNKQRSSSLFSSPKTKWRMNGWLLSPGLATYLGTQKGKTKQGALAPVSSTKDELLFTTDKDEFLYYVPTEAGKILLLTDPLFADRVRSGQDEEIRYGRMPAKLFCNNRTVEGTLFYQRWAWIDPPQQKRKGPFAGLEPGGRLFAVWGPGGEFLYVEKGGGERAGWEGPVRGHAGSPGPLAGDLPDSVDRAGMCLFCFSLSRGIAGVRSLDSRVGCGGISAEARAGFDFDRGDRRGRRNCGRRDHGRCDHGRRDHGRRFPSSGHLLDFPGGYSPGEGTQFGRVLSPEGKHLGRAESEGGLRHRFVREGTMKRVA